MKSYVYIVGSAIRPWAFKIGYSCRPKQRLAALRRQFPRRNLIIWYMEQVPLGLNPILIEATMHQRFRRQRLYGEWFEMSLGMLREALQQTVRCPPKDQPPCLPHRTIVKSAALVANAYAEAQANWRDFGGR